MSRRPNRNAVARTLAVPGVSLEEAIDHNAPKIDGPSVWKVNLGIPVAMHLRRYAARKTLCGEGIEGVKREGTRAICQECRIEASRMRAVIV